MNKWVSIVSTFISEFFILPWVKLSSYWSLITVEMVIFGEDIMEFNRGETYTFKDVQRRYKLLKPNEKGLTQGGFLNPSCGNPSTLIRAVFAREEINGPLDNLLFISGDNSYRNYLNRMEKVHRENSPFLYFKEKNREWFFVGDSKVDRILEPDSEELTILLEEMGYTLVAVGEEGGAPLWQLSSSGKDNFIRPRKLEFIAVLQS